MKKTKKKKIPKGAFTRDEIVYKFRITFPSRRGKKRRKRAQK